jgi:hypothetical protein
MLNTGKLYNLYSITNLIQQRANNQEAIHIAHLEQMTKETEYTTTTLIPFSAGEASGVKHTSQEV